jgi:hypothetical protein
MNRRMCMCPRRERGENLAGTGGLQSNRGYNRSELNRILKLTRQHQAQLLEAWNEHFDR